MIRANKPYKPEIRTTGNKNRNNIPLIVIDGKTANCNVLINDLKGLIKGEFSPRHTNYTTIIFLENTDDHASVIANIKT